LIADFLSNISAKYYANPRMLSRVIAKNIGDFFETQCSSSVWARSDRRNQTIIPVSCIRKLARR